MIAASRHHASQHQFNTKSLPELTHHYIQSSANLTEPFRSFAPKTNPSTQLQKKNQFESSISIFSIFLITDFTDFPFPSISAAPSLANSPILIRRDSILKHSGSIKNNEKRVSIKHEPPVLVEYLSEKRNQMPTSVSLPLQPPAVSLQSANVRPASLILNSKGERPTFKLVRSTSIEHHESAERLDGNSVGDQQRNTLAMNNLNVNFTVTRDEDDESVPLVQIDSNGTSKMLNNQNASNL